MAVDSGKSQGFEVQGGILTEEEQPVSGVVISAPEAQAALGGGAALVFNHGGSDEQARIAGLANTEAEIDVFEVEEEALVKKTHLLEHAGFEQKIGTGYPVAGNVGLAGWFGFTLR